MFRRTLLAGTALVALAVLPLAACGDDDSGPGNEAEAREELLTQLTGEAGIPPEQAECIVDRLFESYSFEELDNLDLGSDGELPEDLQNDLVDFTVACITGGEGGLDLDTGTGDPGAGTDTGESGGTEG